MPGHRQEMSPGKRCHRKGVLSDSQRLEGGAQEKRGPDRSEGEFLLLSVDPEVDTGEQGLLCGPSREQGTLLRFLGSSFKENMVKVAWKLCGVDVVLRIFGLPWSPLSHQ